MKNRPRHYKKRVPYPPGRRDLHQVVTAQEAARLWFVSTRTIYYHIDAGNIQARKSGKLWLISVESLVAYYGHSPLIKIKKSPSSV